jgi:hypothetical protein
MARHYFDGFLDGMDVGAADHSQQLVDEAGRIQLQE